ncbi:glycosyltransferase family 4 protein [Arthrobacter monumenti]
MTHSYNPENSPPQRRWNAFIKHFRSSEWDVDVVTPVAHFPFGRRQLSSEDAGRPLRRQYGEHGERIFRVPYLRHGTSRIGRLADQLVSAAFSIPAALAAPKPDVVIATAPSLASLGAGYVVAKVRRVPFVVEMRDAWPDLAIDSRVVAGGIKDVVNRVILAIQERAQLVVTVTDGFAATLRQRGIERVLNVSNGVDTKSITELDPPSTNTSRLEVLYLGNHGESQRLETIIRASAIVGERMRLTMVGHGTRRPALMELALALDAPVEFHQSVPGRQVMEYYRRSDSCVISLRDDWKSFETTVPSKTYEVLATGRHITGIVRGEAAAMLLAARSGDVVAADPQEIAKLWTELAVDRERLNTKSSGRQWTQQHADLNVLAGEYQVAIVNLLTGKRPGSQVCTK